MWVPGKSPPNSSSCVSQTSSESEKLQRQRKKIEWIWEIGGVVYIVEMGVGSHGIRKPWDFVFRGELEFGIVSCENLKTEEDCIVFVGSELWIGNSKITSSTRRFVNLQLFGSGSGFGYYGPKTQNFHQRLGPIRVFFFWAWPTSNPNHYWFEMDTTFFFL